MRKAIIFFCMLISSLCLLGQTDVKGVVFDAETNETLVGTSVSIKGSTQGVLTDENGAYSIKAKPTDVLVFKFLGYNEQEITVGTQTTINVRLVTDGIALQETVVTALGIKRDTRALGYAISTVRGDDLIKAGLTNNPLSALYGKAAGVGIQATAAGPMGGIKINVRGAQGLESTSSTRPLFVVDGVPMSDSDSDMSSRGYDPLNSFDYGSAVNDLNPEDIASMEILKGAKASVLYGSRGANGVVLITTKSGAGTRGLGVQLSYGLETEVPYQLIKFQNEYGSGVNEYDMNYTDGTKTTRRVVSSRYGFGPKFDGSDIMFFDGTTRKYQAYEDNYMAPFNNGSTSSFSAAIQGGNDKGNMRLSFTNFDYNGTMPNQGQIKNSLSFNGQITVSPFARFEFVQNIYNVKSTNRRPNLQRFISYGAYNRDYDIETAMNSYKDENGYRVSLADLTNIEASGWGWPAAFAGDQDGFFSMLWNNNENRNHDNRLHTVTSAKAFFTPLPYLTLTVQGGLDYTDTEYIKKNKIEKLNAETGLAEGGLFRYSRERNKIQNYDAFLSFDKKFKDTWNVYAMIGTSYRKENYTSVGVGTYGGLKFPDYWMLDNGSGWPSSYSTNVSSYGLQDESMYSVFGQATLSYNMEYVLELQARNDWASTLPKLNRSYFYPGVSLVWNFTERFHIPKVNYGKLRLSWADVGRAASRYYAYKAYEMGTLPAPNTNINDVVAPQDLFSGDLKPERKREFETGFNLRLFDSRVEVDFAYYNSTLYNQIMSVPLSPTTAANYIRINAGKINNQGLEFFVKGTPIKTNFFNWELSLNLSKQWDKVVDLYPGITQISNEYYGIELRAAEGERMGSLWTQDYLKDENGNRIVNANGQYQISNDAKDRICVGTVNPNIIGGLTSNFYFQGDWGMLNLMAGFDFRQGGKVLSISNYYLMGNGVAEESLQYRDAAHGGLTWTETLSDGTTRERHDGLILPGVKADGTPNDIVINAYNYYSTTYNRDDYRNWAPDLIKDNNYIKFRELSLNYTFSKKISSMLRLQKLSVGLTARNLGYLYKSIPNIDAEALLGTSGSNSWIEYSNYPASRTYGFKVNVSF